MFPQLCFQNCGPSSLVFGDIALDHHTLSQNKYTAHIGTVLRMSANPGQPVVSTPSHTLFKLGTNFHIGAPRRFEDEVGITTDFRVHWSESERPRGSHSAKGLSLRVAAAAVDCHLNCWRAAATTFFKFKVHSTFPSSHSTSCSSCSSLN